MFVKRIITPADKYFDYRGAKIGYTVIGKGKPVVMLHGSMVADPWGGVENELAQHFKVYLPHLPGFGSSEIIGFRRHNTALFSLVFSEFLKKAGLQSAPIIAFSLGAVVAIRSALDGTAAGKLILVGVPIKADSRQLQTTSRIPVWIRRLIGSTVWGRRNILVPVLRDVIGGVRAGGESSLLHDMATTDTRSLVDLDYGNDLGPIVVNLIQKLKNKTVFIYGADDKLYPGSNLPIPKPVTIAGSGHNIFFGQPQKTVETVIKLL